MSLALTIDSNLEVSSKARKHSRIQFKNEAESFQMAKGFFKEYSQKGISSFAFSTVGYKNSQQKAMLAVACYFSQVQFQKTSLITDSLDGVFKPLIAGAMEVEILTRDGVVVTGYQFEGMYIFDMESIMDLASDEKISLESILATIKEYSDVIFFDLPELETIKENLNIYRPIVSAIESLSVIYFEDNENKIVEEVYNHFDRNGIDLRGSLIQTP
ncbi:hypothetical protein [Halobacteriovorax sp. HLS]|uniref:hypothetical protein n=1 Tax=Halobacteriovorax sp. HLS TaxID=2234000 RepID=UPI000FD87E57|nr:hypothetical protein [Halobacteriovorax sp. HLS]